MDEKQDRTETGPCLTRRGVLKLGAMGLGAAALGGAQNDPNEEGLASLVEGFGKDRGSA